MTVSSRAQDLLDQATAILAASEEDVIYKGVVASVAEIEQLESYPHHFHRRAEDGIWVFEASPMHGDVAHEIDIVIAVVRAHLQT